MLVTLVRKEIEDEVNRVNREMAIDYWKPDDQSKKKSEVNGEGDGI